MSLALVPKDIHIEESNCQFFFSEKLLVVSIYTLQSLLYLIILLDAIYKK